MRFQITNGPTPATMGLLKEKKIDFGVVSGPLEKQEGVHLMPVRKIEDIFVADETFWNIPVRNNRFPFWKSAAYHVGSGYKHKTLCPAFLEQRKVFVHPEFELATRI
ncbi:MAG: hypothetical protein ACLURV_03930 [Gallintestinimicrobium sp.]